MHVVSNRREQRADLARKLGHLRFMLATTHHRTPENRTVDLSGDGPGGVEYGDTSEQIQLRAHPAARVEEYLLIDAFASAMLGLHVRVLCPTVREAHRLAAAARQAIDRAELYRAAMRSHAFDTFHSARFFCMGGTIHFAASNARSELGTLPVDKLIVVDPEAAEPEGLAISEEKLAVSPWQFITRGPYRPRERGLPPPAATLGAGI